MPGERPLEVSIRMSSLVEIHGALRKLMIRDHEEAGRQGRVQLDQRDLARFLTLTDQLRAEANESSDNALAADPEAQLVNCISAMMTRVPSFVTKVDTTTVGEIQPVGETAAGRRETDRASAGSPNAAVDP